MPSARSSRAPHFSGREHEVLPEFLHEYEELADGFGLTEEQKVETILRYVPRTLQSLWKTLPGYQARDWEDFRAHLGELYPDVAANSRHTKHGLETFRELSAKYRVRSEAEVLKYYRNFLTVAAPLLDMRRISIDDYNSAFFKGFHPSIQDILAERFEKVHPHHPVREPYHVEGILDAARRHFTSDHFHQRGKSLKGKAHDKQHSRSKRHHDTPDAFIQRTYGVYRSFRRRRSPTVDSDSDDSYSPGSESDSDSDAATDTSSPEYETKNVRFKSSHSSRPKGKKTDSGDPLSLVTKLQSLSVNDPSYLVLYSQCQERFPVIAQNLPKPQLLPAVSTSASALASVSYQSTPVATQTPPSQPYLQPQPPAPASAPASIPTSSLPTDPKADFFGRNSARAQGCAFCGHLGHRIHACPAAEEYVDTGRVKIINRRLYLPTGHPIPNDGRGLGLKAGVDTWLATNPQYSNTTKAPTTQRDPPPHAASFSFEVIPGPTAPTGAYITEADADSDTGGGDDTYPTELYDMFEVFAAKKADPAPSIPTVSKTPPTAAPPSPFVPFIPNARPPQCRYQASAEDQALTKQVMDWILEGKLDHITPAHIFATSPPIRKELVERLRPRRIETNSFEQVSHTDPVSVLELTAKREAEYSPPLREIDVLVNNLCTEAGILDQGSQIVVIREDLAKEVGARINTQLTLRMEGANGSTSRTLGCAEDLKMRIGDVSFTIHAHVIRTAPFRLLLGRPFHHLLLCRLEDHPDRVDVSIRDPANPSHSIAVPSRARQATQVGFVSALACEAHLEPPRMEALEHYIATPASLPLTDLLLSDDDTDEAVAILAYKKVAQKVHPVAASLPEDFRIIRRRPEDPLLSLPPLPTHPPPFTVGTRLTQERYEELDLNKFNFLWPEEVKLAAHVLKVNELALAWTEAERGRFRDDYFSPVKIPTIAHTPWVHKNIPIPTGLHDKVIDIFKEKMAAGVYEPSDASYRSRWFCVPKKNGSLRLVHDLQPLNAVTIRNAAVPPFVDQFVEGIAGHSCFSMLDLLVGYDHRTLDVASRDLTSLQSPLGALRNTTLPQGSTNAVAIFHGDVTFILEPEIPNVAKPFLDDTVVKGPASRYETPDGGYETIPTNAGIRRFIWEHLNDVHRVIHRLGHAGATISAKKIFIAAPEVLVLGHKCTYEGRVPDDSKIAKIRTWPPCKTVTDVRAFLGTAGTMRIWIKDFSATAKPLVDLTRKNIDFVWQDEHDQAMESLKQAIITSSALIPLDYKSGRTAFLAIDSSFRGVGWILSQTCEDGQRRPSRFGSIGWNERESRYSQPKVELYGLFRTLRALRMHIIGLTDLVVEMDAQYVRGMLANPDIQPSAAINRWIAAIQLFDFRLVHIPAEKHQGPDGLSRREPISGEDDHDGDPEEWVDDILSLGLWLDTWDERRTHSASTTKVFQATESVSTPRDELTFPASTAKARTLDNELPAILELLSHGKHPNGHASEELDRLHKQARNFFVHDKRLWRRHAQGRHQLVLQHHPQRLAVTRDAHDKLGHKGFYSTLRALLDRFWWPSLAHDVRWYIKTCHECQIRQTTKVRIPPTVATPAPLFRKAYVDTMFMPHASGYRYIVQARCSLTAWPEWRALRTETGRTLGAFLFEEVLCRWGAVEEIVTDNGTAFVAALDWLTQRFGIRHIRISAYNSRANGIVERQHRTIRESIIKACEGNASKWPSVVPYAFWADRATTRKSTGHSPFYMTHGIEPVLPFDITLATFLVPNLTDKLSTADLISTRTRQLQRREDDLAAIHTNILKSRFESVRQFERQFENTIRNHDFGPGAFVLVRNSSVESDLGRKAKPRYIGPMVVLRRTQNGSYRLAELDGTVSNLRFAAFRLVPYHARSRSAIPVTRLVDRNDLACAIADKDTIRADSDDV
jgi:integrase-like protein/reverse transcriptase-like protein/aspartyl protease